jgi:serine/threonine protein kinase
MGTPEYASPEQLRSASRVDHRSDLWSLAVLLFQCATGRSMFSGKSIGDIVLAISVEPIPVASEVCPDLPSEIDAFFARALEREPDRRFQSAKEMHDTFARVVAGSASEGAPRPSRKSALPPPSAGDKRAVREDAEAGGAVISDTGVRVKSRGAAQPATPAGGTPSSSRRAVARRRSSVKALEEKLIAFAKWDPKEQVIDLWVKPGVVGLSDASIDTWYRQLSIQLEHLGRKAPMLICIDGAMIPPSRAEKFGALAKQLIGRFGTYYARYGKPDTIRTIVIVEAMNQGYKPNLFETREAALAFLRSGHAEIGGAK